ncbi:MAG: immunoglobulin domain-containing protein, partial [Candidatus Kapabacteria bacterium]|nr:immunoglobulin domain-containing protein [Candidatus Kapabacteria bacterium]
MARLFLRTALAVVIAVSAIVTSFAQSNPTPWNLATQGNYSFTQWDATQAALTYPSSMVFHVFSEPWEPFAGTLDLSPSGDWIAAYNVTGSSRINGEGVNGVSFFATAASQPLNNCGFVGAAVMALNTVGRTEVVVNWTNRLIANGTRPYVMRLQYRIGTTGAWINALDPNGSFYELDGTRTTGTVQSFSYTLPTSLENQSTVQLRWLYFQNGSGTNTRPRIALDDVSIVSQPTTGVTNATNLAIRTISPQSPSQNIPFSVVIRSVDATGVARPVASSTVVTLSRATGVGSLGGTISGVIPAGSSSLVITGVTYNTAEAGVSLTASAAGLTSVTTPTFTVASPATWLWIDRAENVANVGTPMTPFVVRAMRSDNVVDPSYSGTVTLTRVSGPGSLTGTTSVAAVRGVASFENVSFSAAGSYIVRVSAPGLPTADLAEIVVSATPTLITDIVPQYVHGRFPLGTCNWSVRPVPNYARVTFTGLTPNSTYRFNVGGANDQNLTSTGPGWNLHWDGRTHTYTFLNSKSLTTDGSYSVFATAAGETSKSIWINLTATTNIAFEQGTNMFWRVALGDNAGRLIRYYQLAQTSIVLDLGPAANQGTGIVDTYSQATPKNYIALYDNEAGTGRPLTIAAVQPDGAVFVGSTSSQPWYLDIDEDQTAWATIIPNNLPNGVRRIQEHSYLTGAVVGAITSTNGLWNNVNTVNPTGGFTTPIYLQTPRINVLSPVDRDTVCGAQALTIRYIARGVSGVRLEYSSTDGVSWEPIATVDFALPGNTPVDPTTGEYAYNWIVRGSTFNSNYRIRATALNRSDVSSMTGRFVMALSPVVLEQPVSKDLCLGGDYTFVALTTGSVRRYQWFKNGVEIPGANTAIFTIEDAHYTSNGVYTCLVEGYGSCGNIVSDGAHIRVSKPIALSNQTFRAAADLGGTAVLSVEAEGPHEFTYQWYRGQNPLVESSRIRGVTSSRLEIMNIGSADLGNDYWCQVTGTCGTIASRVMRVYS